MEEINITYYNEVGGFNPYSLKWDEEISFPSTKRLSEFGNRVYNRYPARSIFLVPRAILAQHRNKRLNILDPFMGSGTTAVETILSGNIAYGVEMDPFARLISDVSSTIFTETDFENLDAIFEEISLRWETYMPTESPHLTGIERWFKDNDMENLLKLKACIYDICPLKYRPFMMVTYADCIKPVSLMERQSLKPYISRRVIKKTKTVNESFAYSFNNHREALRSMALQCKGKNMPLRWLGTDATNFNAKNIKIDLAITSPPYINALDYTRCVKIEGAFCDCIDNDIAREMRSLQVGHENRKNHTIEKSIKDIFDKWYIQIFDKDREKANTCLSYFNDIYANLKCVYRLLKPLGEYYIIIGDNVIKKIHVPTHEIILEISKYVGFDCFGLFKYQIKDHRTSIPRANSHQKIEYEYVLMLRKTEK